jgi:hypothetical protein
MAGTTAITIVNRLSFGNLKGCIVDLDTTAYASAGVTLSAAQLEMKEIIFADFRSTENGYHFTYDYTNGDVQIWFYDYDAVADGAAIDFTNTGDAGTCRGIVFGY